MSSNMNMSLFTLYSLWLMNQSQTYTCQVFYVGWIKGMLIYGNISLSPQSKLLRLQLTTTSHTRPRACDQYTSSTLIGGNGGAGPISLHTMLKGPT